MEIYIKVCNGLANRLRTICSFYYFSQKLSADLKICWELGPGWSDESFYDLFDLPKLNFISNKEYEKASNKFKNLDKIIKKSSNAKEYKSELSDKEIIDIIINESFCYKGDSCLFYIFPQYFKENFDFLKLLQPNKKINKKINKILKDFNENTVGIHIRRGDATSCQFKENYLISSLDSFEDKMNLELIKNKKTKFFLATDCPNTEAIFKNKFKVITNEDKNFVESNYFNPKFNQEDAVIDMFLLSKTKKILGTNWSSFSTVSSKLNQIPLNTVKEKNNNKNYENPKNFLLVKIPENLCFNDSLTLLSNFYFKCLETKKKALIEWRGKNYDYFFENFYIKDFDFYVYNELPSEYDLVKEFDNKESPYEVDFFRKIRPYKKDEEIKKIIEKNLIKECEEFILFYLKDKDKEETKTEKGFDLITSFKLSNDNSVNLDHLYCLKKNQKNKNIKSITVFTNNQNNLVFKIIYDLGIMIKQIDKIDLSHIKDQCRIENKTIIAHSNIIFNDKLKTIDFNENENFILNDKDEKTCAIFVNSKKPNDMNVFNKIECHFSG